MQRERSGRVRKEISSRRNSRGYQFGGRSESVSQSIHIKAIVAVIKCVEVEFIIKVLPSSDSSGI